MYISLVGFTLVAWLIHSLAAAGYSRFFQSTKSMQFRAVHAIEIFVTVTVMLLIYKAVRPEDVATIQTLLTVLGTLVVLDGASLVISKKLRKQFDIGHFAFAYLVIASATVLVTV